MTHFDSHSNSSRKVGIIVLILKRRNWGSVYLSVLFMLESEKLRFKLESADSKANCCSGLPWCNTDLQLVAELQRREKADQDFKFIWFCQLKVISAPGFVPKTLLSNVGNLKASFSFPLMLQPGATESASAGARPGHLAGQWGQAPFPQRSTCWYSRKVKAGLTLQVWVMWFVFLPSPRWSPRSWRH